MEDYEIRSELGRGGMGVVYRALQKSLRREVALKVLVVERRNSAVAGARFMREIRVLMKLDHPNIIHLFDCGQSEEGWFYAMELLEARPLDELIRGKGGLPVPRALALIHQAAGALVECHANGLVHRDVKLSNLMVDGRGHLTLMDFGLSLIEGGTALTAAGAMVGSPRYLAPEAIIGPSAEDAADVYALGICLHELLDGWPAFTGSTLEEILHKIIEKGPEPIEVLQPEVPPAVAALVRRAVSGRPGDRPTAAEFRDEAARILARIHGLEAWSPSMDLSLSGSRVLGEAAAEVRARIADPGEEETSPASRARRAPSGVDHAAGRGALPWLAVAGLALVLALGARIFLMRSPARVGRLELRVTPDLVRLAGTHSGHGDLSVSLEGPEGGSERRRPWPRPSGADVTSVEIPLPGKRWRLETASEVVIRHDGDDLVRIPVPEVGAWTLHDFEHLEIRSSGNALREWGARFSGDGPDQTRFVAGRAHGGGVTFEPWTVPRSWNRVRLDSLTASGTVAPVGDTGPPVPCSLTIEYGRSLATGPGLESWVTGPHRLAERAFDPGGEGTDPGRLDREVTRFYHDYFRDPERDIRRKLAAHEWIRKLGDVYNGSLVNGSGRSPVVEAVLNSWIEIRFSPVDQGFRLDRVPRDQILGFVEAVTLDNHLLNNESSLRVAMQEALSPPEELSPALISQVQDPDSHRDSHTLAAPPPGFVAPGRSVVLTMVAWNLERHQMFRLIVPGAIPGRNRYVDIRNLDDRFNHKNPAPGPMDPADNVYSWRNIPRTGARVEIVMPGEFFSDHAGGDLVLEYRRSFRCGREMFKRAAVVGYRWSARDESR